MSSADNYYKQFGPRSGPTNRRAWSESILFDTDGIPERFFPNFNYLLTSVVCWQLLQTVWTQTRLIWIHTVRHSDGNPERFFFFKKKSADDKKHAKLPSRQRVNAYLNDRSRLFLSVVLPFSPRITVYSGNQVRRMVVGTSWPLLFL